MTEGGEFDAAYWALESDPANPRRWFEVGCRLLRHAGASHVDLNPLERAAGRFALLAAAEIGQEDAATSFELGRRLESCGELEAASRAYLRAASLETVRPEPCERAAALLARLGRAEDVERWACAGLERARNQDAPSSMLTSLANSLLRAGRSAKAVEVLEHIVETNPSDSQALSNLAVALRRSGNAERSVTMAERAVELAREAPDPYLVLGRSLEAAQRPEEARRAYQQAIARGVATVAAQEAAARLERLDRGALPAPDTGTFSNRTNGDGTFSGDLVVLAVPELLEVLRLQSATGELYLWMDNRGIRLELARGRIVGATAPDGARLTAPADVDAPGAEPFIALISELVGWGQGHFEFMRTAEGLERSGGLDAQFLLMEAMRALDEAGRGNP